MGITVNYRPGVATLSFISFSDGITNHIIMRGIQNEK